MTEKGTSELKVRDILRLGQIPERPIPFTQATGAMFNRILRRPAGNSARIWKRMEWEDPFEDKPIHSRKLNYKGVYAKGRFVRIDKAQPETRNEPKRDPHDELVERMKKATIRQEEEVRAKKAAELLAPKAVVKPPIEPPKLVPVAPPVEPPSETLNRRPPMPTRAPKRRQSGRMSIRNQPQPQRRRAPIVGGTPPGGLSLEDRRPPMPGDQQTDVLPPSIEDTLQPPDAPDLTKPQPHAVDPAVAAKEEGQPLSRTPPTPESTAKKEEQPINRSILGKQGGGGMNDLFRIGGGQGRLRIKKPPPKADDSEE